MKKCSLQPSEIIRLAVEMVAGLRADGDDRDAAAALFAAMEGVHRRLEECGDYPLQAILTDRDRRWIATMLEFVRAHRSADEEAKSMMEAFLEDRGLKFCCAARALMWVHALGATGAEEVARSA